MSSSAARTTRSLQGVKRKISLLCDVPMEAVVAAVDCTEHLRDPPRLHDEGLDEVVCRTLRLDEHGTRYRPVRMGAGGRPPSERQTGSVRIGVVGKYVNLPDAYLSVSEVPSSRRLPPLGEGGRGIHAGRGRAPRCSRPTASTASTGW